MRDEQRRQPGCIARRMQRGFHRGLPAWIYLLASIGAIACGGREDGSRVLAFTDVTMSSGITATGYGMGAATGDYNNDGCIDLFVTNLGPNQLWRNNCDGTFTDVSSVVDRRSDAAGAADPSW